MKKFKLFCIKYALFIYENHILMDWSIYTKLGKVYYYPFWFIRSCIIWVLCPLFYFEYWLKECSVFKYMQLIEKDPKYQTELMKFMKYLNF